MLYYYIMLYYIYHVYIHIYLARIGLCHAMMYSSCFQMQSKLTPLKSARAQLSQRQAVQETMAEVMKELVPLEQSLANEKAFRAFRVQFEAMFGSF